MNLTVPTNWDAMLIDMFNQINISSTSVFKIGQVYGATLTRFGDGRPETQSLPDKIIRGHIASIHDLGIPFNFVINAPSMGGVEHDRRYRTQIVDTIHWLEDLGVDIVTVANPFIGELVLYHAKQIKVKISTILDVKTVQGIKNLTLLGPEKIDGITVSFNINREFEILRKMVRLSDFKVEVLANIRCILNCPYQSYHYDLVGSYARPERGYQEPYPGYTPLGCDLVRLKDLSEVIKSPWIRPEDLNVYEKIGIHSVKIAGRTMTTQAITKIINAYALAKFDGNLWDLIAPQIPIEIDNNRLQGFIDFFTQKKFLCMVKCGECHYCDDIAKDIVRLKQESTSYLEDLKIKLEARIDTGLDYK